MTWGMEALDSYLSANECGLYKIPEIDVPVNHKERKAYYFSSLKSGSYKDTQRRKAE